MRFFKKFCSSCQWHFLQKRKLTMTFPDNFRSSRHDVFFKLTILKNLRKFRLNDIYLFFWTLSVFWVFFTSVGVVLKLLVMNIENPLQWRLQTRLFFAFTENIFVWWGAIIETTLDSVNQ